MSPLWNRERSVHLSVLQHGPTRPHEVRARSLPALPPPRISGIDSSHHLVDGFDRRHQVARGEQKQVGHDVVHSAEDDFELRLEQPATSLANRVVELRESRHLLVDIADNFPPSGSIRSC
jgi:hypothetical protein